MKVFVSIWVRITLKFSAKNPPKTSKNPPKFKYFLPQIVCIHHQNLAVKYMTTRLRMVIRFRPLKRMLA
jgi:hypothetical protein